MIILAHAAYWIAVGLVCFAGSATVAAILRRRGHQERWAWAGGLLAALALPILSPILSASAVGPAASGTIVSPSTVVDLAPLRIGVAAVPALEWVGPALLSVWAALSAVLLLRLLSAIRTVARLRRDATPTRVAGSVVRVTRDQGPAVVGFLRPVVLVPEWVVELPAERREWILRHEEEHVRGRDPYLLCFMLLARVAVPWNPVVWWFGGAIRSAIETDCDRRTVGIGGDVLSYGEALISVAGEGEHRGRLPAMAPAFAEQGVPLDHRIEAVTTPRRRVGGMVRVALASVVVVAMVAACEMPAPTASDRDLEPAPEGSVADAVSEADTVRFGPDAVESDETAPATFGPNATDEAPARPRFIPYDQAPRLTNSRDVMQVLEREYPPLLKESGIGGEVTVWLYISEEGRVVDRRIRQDPPGTSGYEALDAAALSVADAMVFTPAMNRDRPTPVWVQIPITFTVGR